MEKPKTIYLADDDADDRFLIKEAMTQVNPDVNFVEAENGAELLDQIEDPEIPDPSLIMLDMNMPVMNGLETIEAIRINPELDEVPAVMISTSNDPVLAGRAIKSGINKYFIKPNTFKGLIEIVQKVIQKFLS
ncbi:response regulator [Dyadobacter psychrotolerans]|uniref:Response regulator n=1 Tax=Dyadobacter psychrotolerans TaxID=2541721 RepID=A0A4R5DIA3_9BACT|nr:response regulator [Dyadobacter psychrotolerans]TDE10485.1 response regulator [Dyadobacter psychrotolerans]